MPRSPENAAYVCSPLFFLLLSRCSFSGALKRNANVLCRWCLSPPALGGGECPWQAIRTRGRILFCVVARARAVRAFGGRAGVSPRNERAPPAPPSFFVVLFLSPLLKKINRLLFTTRPPPPSRSRRRRSWAPGSSAGAPCPRSGTRPPAAALARARASRASRAASPL